ncbi:myoneurin-like [Cydia splendana]|uniref:myoneurin-like n=1 Tax=Cydia splendana TaxID=1100963 RepID=UPI0021458399
MASSVDLKVVIQHIVNGTLADNLCLICLKPLDELNEHILTTICKEGKEYCIADVLEQVCHVKFSDVIQHRVCSDCFVTASAAFKFFLSAKRSQEILNFYTEELQQNMDFINTDLQNSEDSICISLPLFTPSVQAYDYDLEGLALQNSRENADDNSDIEKHISAIKKEVVVKEEVMDEDDDVIVVMNDNKPSFLKPQDGNLVLVDKVEEKKYMKMFGYSDKVKIKVEAETAQKSKKRKKRKPMTFMFCSQCPVKYRFGAKLRDHMKNEHNIDLFVCRVCKATMEDEQEFNNHLKTHTNTHICAICNMVFKKRDTIISHLKKHEAMHQSAMTGSHICELCGQVLADEDHLKQHYEKKHDKKYTCYYCGKMYKGEISFDSHIKKHEEHLRVKNTDLAPAPKPQEKPPKKKDKRFHCDLCGGNFVDERALMWHTRLHTNERPHICEICGRGFVSVNRRNQHAKCAHSAPSRRCPLCPSLFHLRSMVNTHIKKVHLKAHKRRNRTSKYQEVYWRTEPVPIQELSVSIQNEILELKAAQEDSEDRGFGPDWVLGP